MKSGYLKVLFVGLPFGLGCLITGINKFIEIPNNIDGLVLVEGEVSKYGLRRIKSDDSNYEVFYIEVKQKGWYYTELKKRKKILQTELSVNLKKTNHVKIWHRKNRRNIEQVSVGERKMYEYKPPYWMAHFFFWIGLITLVSGVGYLILHPEDLTGKKRKGKVSKW